MVIVVKSIVVLLIATQAVAVCHGEALHQSRGVVADHRHQSSIESVVKPLRQSFHISCTVCMVICFDAQFYSTRVVQKVRRLNYS